MNKNGCTISFRISLRDLWCYLIFPSQKKIGMLVDNNRAKRYSELGNILQYNSNKNGCTRHLKLCQKSFSELDGSFFEKMAMSRRKKFSMGKNFQNRYFRFKIRFEPFLIDSDQKKFFENFSIFWSSIFRKNGYVPEKKF